ncbi:MAG: alpha/beta hydrolase fold domain-containing protein [Robiginitomaculum sp.]|nr:alpha/beta hydrolase fold domain-containing protein [Robiginitomaculum sp.]
MNKSMPNFGGHWLIPPSDADAGLMVYVPGGSFAVGPSPRVIAVMRAIADKAGLALLMAQYRLAPEHVCPAAVEDVAELLRDLRRSKSWSGEIVLAGEQIGPNLIMAGLQQNTNEMAGDIAAMVFFSPWLDLTLSAWSALTVNMGTLNVHSREQAELAVRFYLGMENPKILPDNPIASPLFGSLEPMAPLMIHVADGDLSLDDARTLMEKLTENDGASFLHIWPRVSRMWERYELEYCQQSIEISASFIKNNLPV